jgi:predicted ATPase
LSAAEGCFLRAIAVAREQEALFTELRAAMSLARLYLKQRRPDEAKKILAPIYDRFTEGFDAPDLLAARDLLEQFI